MEIQFVVSKLFLSAAAIAAVGLIFQLYNVVVAQPRKLRSALLKQGLSGPPPTILLGNILEMKKARDAAVKAAATGCPPTSHNCGSILLPFFDEWRKKYGINFLTNLIWYIFSKLEIINLGGCAGDVFIFSLGNTQIVHVTQPEMVRDITTCTSLDLGKPTYQARERGALLGQGILTSNGTQWVHQRKILAPELYMDKVKVGASKLFITKFHHRFI